MPQLVHNESGEDGAEEGEDGVEGGDHATTRIPSAKGVTLKRQSTGNWTGFGLILQFLLIIWRFCSRQRAHSQDRRGRDDGQALPVRALRQVLQRVPHPLGAHRPLPRIQPQVKCLDLCIHEFRHKPYHCLGNLQIFLCK